MLLIENERYTCFLLYICTWGCLFWLLQLLIIKFTSHFFRKNLQGSCGNFIHSCTNKCFWHHHFERTAAKFFLCILFIVLTFTYFTFCGMMAAGLTPAPDLAAVVASACNSLWNLLSGFFLLQNQIFRDGGSGSTTSALLHGLFGVSSTQLGDVETIIDQPEFKGTIKEYLEVNLGFGPGMIAVSAAMLVGFCVFFFGIFAFKSKIPQLPEKRYDNDKNMTLYKIVIRTQDDRYPR